MSRGKRRSLQERVWDYVKRALIVAPNSSLYYSRIFTESVNKEAQAEALQRRLRESGDQRHKFRQALAPYQQFLHSPIVDFRVHRSRGVCVVARRTLQEGERVEVLVGIWGRKVSRLRAESSFSAFEAQEAVTSSGRPRLVRRLLFGPLAFVNHACAIHANCREVNQWRGLQTLEEIEEGDELFICYSDDADTVYRCPFC